MHGPPGHATPDPGTRHGGTDHLGAGYGVLFADALALTAEPGLTAPARTALRAVAAHLADLIRRAQADGGIRPDADPEAAAWLMLSVLATRRLRADAMPEAGRLEASVTTLALQALADRAAGTRQSHHPAGDDNA
jgi:hypothetical protein